MEEQDIRKLFSGFRPPLSDGQAFMARLQERMDLIDDMLQYRARLRRESRRAVIIAASLGFLTGVILTLLLPWMTRLAAHLLSSMTTHPYDLYLNPSVMSWCMLALAVMTVSLSSYRLLFSRIKTPGF